MIDTKLILIEGIPGSGKSTTAWKLAAEIENSGRNCNCFLEWDDPHPIFIGYERDIAKIISSSGEHQDDILKQWAKFAGEAQTKEAVNIIESRFWQTGVMFMYLAGHSEDEVIESNQRVVTAIADLKPVLIYFTNDNIEKALTRTFQIKNEQWAKAGRGETAWEDFFSAAVGQQKLAADSGLEGREVWFRFFSEWTAVAEKLYDRFAFPKIKIQNPHSDWNLNMAKIRVFLGLA